MNLLAAVDSCKRDNVTVPDAHRKGSRWAAGPLERDLTVWVHGYVGVRYSGRERTKETSRVYNCLRLNRLCSVSIPVRTTGFGGRFSKSLVSLLVHVPNVPCVVERSQDADELVPNPRRVSAHASVRLCTEEATGRDG